VRASDGWDGESLVTRLDRETGAWIFIALHSSRLGAATGGTRMKPYPDRGAARADAMRLAEGMTCKWAVSGFPRGGGKAVIAVPPGLDPSRRPGLLRRYGEVLRELGGLFWTGGDVGTSSADMDVIGETGAPYVFSRTPSRGGAGDSGGLTALGVFCAMETVCWRLFGDPSLRGRRVLVQGAGSVGSALIERLVGAGAIVSFSDMGEASIRRHRDAMGLTFVSPEAVFDAPCEIFAPCALGGVLNADTIPRLACRSVVGAANNQLAGPGDAERLRARGILYAPDFAANAGGAVGITGIEAMGWSLERAEREVRAIGATLRGIFEAAEAAGITTDAAARRIASERLRAPG